MLSAFAKSSAPSAGRAMDHLAAGPPYLTPPADVQSSLARARTDGLAHTRWRFPCQTRRVMLHSACFKVRRWGQPEGSGSTPLGCTTRRTWIIDAIQVVHVLIRAPHRRPIRMSALKRDIWGLHPRAGPARGQARDANGESTHVNAGLGLAESLRSELETVSRC